VHEPERRSSRVWRAIGLLAIGLLMVFAAEELLRALLIALGVYLIARAVSALIAALAEWRGWSLERFETAAQEARVSDPIRARRVLAVAAVLIVVVAAAAGIGLSLALRPGDESVEPTARTGKCNGSRVLCERRLNQVAFLGTHNSYAGTGYRGFLFPEQEGTISTQLENGVRGLWIDTYYGVPGKRVFTRTDKINPALNAQLKASLGPEFEQAGQRIRESVAKPPADAPTRIYLCHGFCELGAVDAEQAFKDIRSFLEQNPEEVLIIDLEDYTTPEDTVALLEKTGLADLVYKGRTSPQLPTLREMVDSGGRILLVVEHRTAGAPSWYRPAYTDLFQETPYQFKRPAEMSCAANRGGRSNPLFLINNWIDTDPTPKPSNAAIVNARAFLLARARSCERERGRFPNVLNVDFFAEGQPGEAVAELNRSGP